eukprot:gene36074-44488_t
MMPVYRAGAPVATALERKAAWLGDTATVLRAPSLVDKILQSAGLLQDGSLALRVYIGDPQRAGNLVFSHGELPQPPGASHPLARWFAFHQHALYRQTYTVLGQPWEVRVTALPQPFIDSHLGSLCTLLGGVLFSVLMAALVQSLVLRSRRVQMLVDARTAELRQSNERLADDVAMRKHTERALLDSEQRFRRLLALSSDWYWEQDSFYRFTSITDGFFEKGHINPGRFIGRTRWDSTPEMLTARWGRDHIARLEARLPFSNLEYAITGDDGIVRWFNTS